MTLDGVQVIIVGCGRVGSELAVALQRRDHTVTIVDKRRGAFAALPSEFTGETVLGSGFDRSDLEAAGILKCDAFAAVTSGDNTNIVSARIARELYDVPRVVARIYDPRRAVIYQRLGIPTVASVTWATEQVVRRLDASDDAIEWTDPGGEVALIERALPDVWAGKPLASLVQAAGAVLVSVRRGERTLLGAPGLVGQPDDIVYLAVPKASIETVRNVLAEGTAKPGAHS